MLLSLVERKSMKIRGEKRSRWARAARTYPRAVHVFVLDECKYIYQEGCSSSFRDVVVVRLFYFIRFARWLPGCVGFTREWKFNENRRVFQRKRRWWGGCEKRGGDGLKKLALNENVIHPAGESVSFVTGSARYDRDKTKQRDLLIPQWPFHATLAPEFLSRKSSSSSLENWRVNCGHWHTQLFLVLRDSFRTAKIYEGGGRSFRAIRSSFRGRKVHGRIFRSVCWIRVWKGVHECWKNLTYSFCVLNLCNDSCMVFTFPFGIDFSRMMWIEISMVRDFYKRYINYFVVFFYTEIMIDRYTKLWKKNIYIYKNTEYRNYHLTIFPDD